VQIKPLSDAAARQLLRRMRLELEERLTRIGADRRRQQDPLSADSSERAVQRENDDTVDAIEASTSAELGQVDAAMARLDAGQYGLCERCGNPIDPVRLMAIPYGLRCVDCAGPGASVPQT
jgi:RNA polymerase-binding transcription factor DksA